MKKAAEQLVDHANVRSDAARAALMATLDELRLRLDPRIIAAEQMEALLGRAQRTANDVGTNVRARPVATTGGLVAFLVAVGLRVWIARRAKSRTGETSARKNS